MLFLCLISVLCAQKPLPLTGTWEGKIEIHEPQGKAEQGRAVLWIGDLNGQAYGSFGETPENTSRISNIKLSSESAVFDWPFRNSNVHFEFHEKGGLLSCEAHPAPEVVMDLDLSPAPQTHTLFETVVGLDKRLFNAFNACDETTCAEMFARDLEFYHDRDGVTNYAQNVDSFKQHFASPDKIRRELDGSTLEVYPIKGFGAIESGVHYFYTTYPGKKEQLTATAKFVHVWQHKDGKWQISRVVSYDHR